VDAPALSPARLLLRALFLALAACGATLALVGPLDGAARPYALGLQRTTDAIVRPIGDELQTRVRPKEVRARGLGRRLPLEVSYRERGGRLLGRRGLDARRVGYLPTATFLALWIVTFLPWRRRLFALVAGLGLVQLFVAWRITMRIGLGWSVVAQNNELELSGVLGARWFEELATLWMRLEQEAFPGVIVPLAIWGLVSFRASDWERWFPNAAGREA